jgi:hypothetical protein
VSSNPNPELHLQSVRLYPGSTQVQYTFITQDKEHCYSAQLSDTSGIRSVVISDALDEFLKPYLSMNPHLVKKLVAETWRLAAEKQPFTPVRLV